MNGRISSLLRNHCSIPIKNKKELSTVGYMDELEIPSSTVNGRFKILLSVWTN